MLVAVDGLAGSGKTTVSEALAKRLGLERLDTGAMYRSVTWAVLERGLKPDDPSAVAAVVGEVEVRVEGGRSVVDGTDVTEAIRGPEVTAAVSTVSANPAVRRAMVGLQRQWVRDRGGGVVEGRDIASVVFPDADLKVFLVAAEGERARRRALQDGGSDPSEVGESLRRRDRYDSSREVSPLKVAEGARVVDTTGRTVADVVEELVGCL